MAKNQVLAQARNTKNDEFYTQYSDIQTEVNAYLEYDMNVFRGRTVLLPCDDPEWSNFTKFFAQNFEYFGLKKLIATSFAPKSKIACGYLPGFAPTDSEAEDFQNGKLLILTGDTDHSGRIDINDLEPGYLKGDGDFRSAEVTKLRDEADIIVTNPPFSLFREFVEWIMKGEKKFLIIGSMNAITYKEIFPLIKRNQIWLGIPFPNGNAYFEIPDLSTREWAPGVFNQEKNLVKFRNCCWFTNLDHGRRHQRLELMTMADNLRYSRHQVIKERGYPKYDNYDAIEVPFTDAIPADYDGVMGVPISFLDRYCPEQFEILGITKTWFGGATKIYPEQIQIDKNGQKSRVTKLNDGPALKLEKKSNEKTCYQVNSNFYEQMYARILIRKKRGIPS